MARVLGLRSVLNPTSSKFCRLQSLPTKEKLRLVSCLLVLTIQTRTHPLFHLFLSSATRRRSQNHRRSETLPRGRHSIRQLHFRAFQAGGPLGLVHQRRARRSAFSQRSPNRRHGPRGPRNFRSRVNVPRPTEALLPRRHEAEMPGHHRLRVLEEQRGVGGGREAAEGRGLGKPRDRSSGWIEGRQSPRYAHTT